jgi:hypothetical protein
MSQKEAYIQKLQAKFDQWDAEIAKLTAKAKQADADARVEYHERIDDLQTKRKEVEEKVDELRQAGDAAWEDLKVGVEIPFPQRDLHVRSVDESVDSTTLHSAAEHLQPVSD